CARRCSGRPTATPASRPVTRDASTSRRSWTRQTAADLGVTEDEARRRLRLGLQLLSSANRPFAEGGGPPGYGRAR
ncbi:hypothetical protein ACWCQ0_48205, partial [Streptomyces massasporeus]